MSLDNKIETPDHFFFSCCTNTFIACTTQWWTTGPEVRLWFSFKWKASLCTLWNWFAEFLTAYECHKSLLCCLGEKTRYRWMQLQSWSVRTLSTPIISLKWKTAKCATKFTFIQHLYKCLVITCLSAKYFWWKEYPVCLNTDWPYSVTLKWDWLISYGTEAQQVQSTSSVSKLLAKEMCFRAGFIWQ